MHHLLIKLRKDPLRLLRQVIFKIFIFPFKYGRTDGYDARKYWEDRFKKYDPQSLRAVGDEGLTEEDNQKAREKALAIFKNICAQEHIDFPKTKICEIGCGTGFYTHFFFASGAKDYLGLDITDARFPYLKSKYPDYRFVRKDITRDPLEETFDLIVMIDVIQHIVHPDHVLKAMDTLKQRLAPEGILLLAPLRRRGHRALWHVRTWSFHDIDQWFGPAYDKKRILLRTNEYLYIIRRNDSHG